MLTSDAPLGQEHFGPTDKPFVPVARYYPDMDFLLYLNTDCPYRADRVDAFTTLLWHPTESRLVGLKLKGFRFLFNQFKVVVGLKETDFLPLVRFLEMALVGGIAETAMSQIEQERLNDKYTKAKKFAEEEDISVGPEVYSEAA